MCDLLIYPWNESVSCLRCHGLCHRSCMRNFRNICPNSSEPISNTEIRKASVATPGSQECIWRKMLTEFERKYAVDYAKLSKTQIDSKKSEEMVLRMLSDRSTYLSALCLEFLNNLHNLANEENGELHLKHSRECLNMIGVSFLKTLSKSSLFDKAVVITSVNACDRYALTVFDGKLYAHLMSIACNLASKDDEYFFGYSKSVTSLVMRNEELASVGDENFENDIQTHKLALKVLYAMTCKYSALDKLKELVKCLHLLAYDIVESPIRSAPNSQHSNNSNFKNDEQDISDDEFSGMHVVEKLSTSQNLNLQLSNPMTSQGSAADLDMLDDLEGALSNRTTTLSMSSDTAFAKPISNAVSSDVLIGRLRFVLTLSVVFGLHYKQETSQQQTLELDRSCDESSIWKHVDSVSSLHHEENSSLNTDDKDASNGGIVEDNSKSDKLSDSYFNGDGSIDSLHDSTNSTPSTSYSPFKVKQKKTPDVSGNAVNSINYNSKNSSTSHNINSNNYNNSDNNCNNIEFQWSPLWHAECVYINALAPDILSCGDWLLGEEGFALATLLTAITAQQHSNEENSI